MAFQQTEEMRRVESLFRDTDLNFLVLGSAGTGKSDLLQRLVRDATKPVGVLAPTGLAALAAGGRTIHSFFGFAPGFQSRTSLALNGSKQPPANLKAILIDEVSMVRADLLDAIDARLRDYGPRRDEPFGGLQIGLFGDLLQLPPVVTQNVRQAFMGQDPETWKSEWFFDATAYAIGCFTRVTLKTVFRQHQSAANAPAYVRALSRLREARMQQEDFDLFNSRVCNKQPEFCVALYPTNAAVEQENKQRFDELPGQPVQFVATRSANWPPDWLDQEPVPPEVWLKPGARVIVCANIPNSGLVNGTVGHVIACDTSEARIRVEDAEHLIERHTWEFPIWEWRDGRMCHDGDAIYTQIPLKLAWAMTIHKAQGQTVDGPMWVDFGAGLWSGGQAYVALSRARSIDRLHLARPLTPAHVRVARRALEFCVQGDSAVSATETRAVARKIYRHLHGESKRLAALAADHKDQIASAAAMLEQLKGKLAEMAEIEHRVRMMEQRICAALDRARTRSWIDRVLGRF